jgi:hypothetical protein
MTATFLAWSHSRRKQFMECPRQLWHCAVAPKGHVDRIDFQQTPAMLAGLEVDDALTARIAKGTPLPAKYAPYEGMVAAVIATPGTKYTQMKVALDRSFKSCGYMDWNNTWVRSIYDCAIINGAHAFILDWKNGSVWPDPDQLKLFAATAFCLFPEVEKVDTSYVWLKPGITDDQSYRRKELPEMWSELLPEVESMQICFKSNQWPATPARGAKSCNYCPVNRQGKCKEAQGAYKG